jgi:hypothetical protein
MEANENMKYLTGLIVALMLLVPAALGNTMTQTNLADAYGSGCCGIITQNELNAGLSIGDNVVTQTNDQFATSHDCFNMEQNSANLALAFGTGNIVTQTNAAWANGGQTDQDQLNAVAVLGHDNIATQSNVAVADEARVGDFFENPIFQNQANLGLIVGVGNALTQTNDAYAVIPKTCTEDPIIIQNQENIGVLISAIDFHDEDEEPPVEPPVDDECSCEGWPYCNCD